jgi:hypothetical protein
LYNFMPSSHLYFIPFIHKLPMNTTASRPFHPTIMLLSYSTHVHSSYILHLTKLPTYIINSKYIPMLHVQFTSNVRHTTSAVGLGIMPWEFANSLGRVLAVQVQVQAQESARHDRFLSENLQEPTRLQEFCGKAAL